MYPEDTIHFKNPETMRLRAISPLSTGNALTLARFKDAMNKDTSRVILSSMR